MFAPLSENWLSELSQALCRRSRLTRQPGRNGSGARAEALEVRTLLSVNLISNYTGMNQLAASGPNNMPGFVTIYSPPDTTGAAGPTSYVETANQGISIFTPKATGTTAVTDSMHDFMFTQGGLAQVLPIPTGATSATDYFSDVTCVWDDLAQRFIVGVQDVNGTTSNFDLAVSKSASPATLTAADWYFYQVNTSETNRAADYPGNIGYNKDALVFTLNQNSTGGGATSVVQVTSIAMSDLIAGNPITPFQTDFNGFSLRPTVMHDSVAGDPMWLIESTAGNGNTINVIRETNELSNAPTFTTTTLNVNPYLGVVRPLQPDGTGLAPASGNGALWTHILKAAEYNNTIAACDHVSVSGTEDDARWYTIDVSSGTPTLQDQGNVSAGNNNYVVFPSIDINSKGDIGLNYSQSGTGAGQFMSMYVTGRNAGDAAGTMQTPVLVKAGVTNNTDGREGDLTGMSVDSTPLAVTGAASQSAVEGASHAFSLGSFADSQGNFWAANEFAASDASWGTQIGQFALSGNGPWSVNVNWGDGSSNTTFTVATPGSLGTQLHTFAEEGSKVVTVTVTNTSGVFDSKSFTANVSDPAVIPTGGFSLTPVEGANSGNQTVATFTDPGGVEPLTDYSASINWGDGTTTTGTITVSAGVFTVKGNHMYAEESAADHAGSTPYVITVTIGHDATPPQTVTSSATVSDPAVVATGGAPFTAVEGQPSAVQTVATFTDPGGPEVAIDYAASISWGDGSTSAGTVVANGDGSFSVKGSHTYATGLGSPGEFGSTFCDGTPPHYSRPIIVTISHELAPTATAVSTAVIAVPPNSAFLTFDGNLIVVGTAGDDQINVTPVGNTGRVNVQINNTKFGPFALAPSGRIVVAALSGNDDVQVAGGVRLPTVLFGGPGDDRLKGGHGPNIEVGCDGNDLLIGGNANDLLIGGAGADRIIGTAGDDTLVAGITSEDYNTLLAYQSNYNLLIGNVTDDGSKDILTGSSGNNVFFGHFQGLGVLDIVNGRPGTQFNT